MPGAVLRAGDHLYLRTDRTQRGVIELCRWWAGEPVYKVRWPHGGRSQHGPKELVAASRSWR
jgi:hypothetical protein